MSESVTRPHQNITELLLKWGKGDKTALDELIPLVYDELRKLAANYLRRKPGAHTLQATALVHEAYVRLADQKGASIEHRAQFFGLAAKVMRDILVDHARKRLATKRGGGQLHLSLGQAERFGHKPEVELVARRRLEGAGRNQSPSQQGYRTALLRRLDDRRDCGGNELVTRYGGTLLEFCASVAAAQ